MTADETGVGVQARDDGLALRESEERFRTICENAPVMIDSFDARGRCVLWNRECERTLGWNHGEMAAMEDPLRVFYPDENVRNQVVNAITEADGTFREYEVLAKNGATRRQLWANFRLPTGALISVGHDVTDQRAMEEQLRHTQKLDALGQLSGGIAHDFNNLLTVIMVNTELLCRVAGDSEVVSERAKEILAAARRGNELVRKLMAFGSKEMLRFEPVDLASVVTELAGTMRRLIPERIDINLELAADTPKIRADVGGLEQILINLATNARDAIEGVGSLTITTSKRSGVQGDLVVLSINDTGTGVSDSIRQRMFEPFFTTKAPGDGAGLGLSMVYGLMQQHGGMVEVSTTPNVGTNVELVFPVHENGDGNPSEEAPPEPAPATVLIVEDERAIREAAEAVLNSEGYEVLLAADGEQALAVLDDNPNVDLIISDVVMPKLGGVELYERLRKRPSMPTFVLTSGYPAKMLNTDLDEVRVLSKPWTVDALLECVADILK